MGSPLARISASFVGSFSDSSAGCSKKWSGGSFLEHAAFNHVRTQPLTLKGHIRVILAGAEMFAPEACPDPFFVPPALADYSVDFI
jgi:hypothetical protein